MEKMKKRNDDENIKWRKLKTEMSLIIIDSKNEKEMIKITDEEKDEKKHSQNHEERS
jgi:hypothetical protein